MKKLLVLILAVAISQTVLAGGQSHIPAQLLEIDNQGRVDFLQNAVKALDVTLEKVKYEKLQSIVVGGDEPGSDFKGGYFIFEAVLSFQSGASQFQRLKCYQFLAVGSFVTLHPHLTKPVVCEQP